MKSNGSRTHTPSAEGCPFGGAGDVPVIGVWNADGQDEIGVYRPIEGRFYLDLDGSRTWGPEDLMTEPLATAADVPGSGDWTPTTGTSSACRY